MLKTEEKGKNNIKIYRRRHLQFNLKEESLLVLNIKSMQEGKQFNPTSGIFLLGVSSSFDFYVNKPSNNSFDTHGGVINNSKRNTLNKWKHVQL